jgi:hypothetical protein
MIGYLERRVLGNPEVQGHSNRFFRTLNRLGERLRSLSPSKEKGKKSVI